jgi:asparagine synthase (glutamine-hydrolysing)
VALTTQLTGRAPDTFSLVFPGMPFAEDGERLDEGEFIDIMVEAVGARSHRHDPRTASANDALRVLRVHADLPDWPNADVLQWPMARSAAAAGHRVLLTGLGGDQWLTGTVARLPMLLRHGHWREAWRFWHEAYGRDRLEVDRSRMARRILVAAAPAWCRKTYRAIRPAAPWPAWLRPSFAVAVGLAERLRALPLRVPVHADAVLRDSLTRFASPESTLARESTFRAADDAGVEARHPFCDRRLVEFVLTLPDDLRFRNGFTRYILREAMGAGLPPAIATRRDKSDGTPMVMHVVHQVLSGLSLQSLRVADAGWVDGDVVRAAATAFLASGTPMRAWPLHVNDLWAILSVELWLRAEG